MVLRGRLVLGLHTLMTLLSLQEVGAIKADHMGSYGPAFYQSYDGAGQFTYDFDGEQLFSVDLKKREAVWRLPEFGNFAYFDPQSGLVSIAMIKAHLEDLVERSNGTRAPNVSPRAAVLPKSRVQLGEPNVLICIVDNIFPPVINITWLRNGHPVTQGVTQSSFYAQPDHSFRKFHYLTFVPLADDFYDCKVEHWGLDQPLFQHWGDGPSERSKCETPFSFLASFLRPLPSQCDSTNFIMLTLNGINPCPIGLLLFGPHTHGRDL
ncbi:HLA class II histocompatibility antigen, DO alpha chain isoform X1 [Bubalus bubalis]|uniref:HLA class II histocompatibility antigen, DO alpha chain isoform X1 n=1 Tax=Bubalus bubalis TaxID=89462 RepID=UPI000DBC701B|nr:HLA class II histocompatibility antigen, DO alpha chain isoform X1 [Bubalus bubalis]